MNFYLMMQTNVKIEFESGNFRPKTVSPERHYSLYNGKKNPNDSYLPFSPSLPIRRAPAPVCVVGERHSP